MGNLTTKSNMFVFHTYWGCIPSYWGNYYCYTVYASIKIHKLVKKSRSIMASDAKPGVVCQIQSSEPYISSQLGVKTHISRSTAIEILHFYRGKPTRNRWLHRQGTLVCGTVALGKISAQIWMVHIRHYRYLRGRNYYYTFILQHVSICMILWLCFRLVYLFIYIWATACIWVNGE